METGGGPHDKAGMLIWRHARFDDDDGHLPDNDIVAYRLAAASNPKEA
jgi:hypothetical protein